MKLTTFLVSRARSCDVRISPYKLRLLADVVRGRSVGEALAWLKTYGSNRTVPVFKVIASAYANAKHKNPELQGKLGGLFIHTIRVDEGGIVRYFKPGARGRGNPQRKRLSHIEVVLGIKGSIRENREQHELS